MDKMTQHEKWMQAMKAYDVLIGFFDGGLNNEEKRNLGKAIRAVNKLRDSFNVLKG
jgi:tellurite resistance protein